MRKLGFDLILLGDIASGKDTQAAILKKKYALHPVESGKYWRALGKRKNLPKSIKEIQAKSLPAPVKIIKEFLIDNIRRVSANKNLVFVGSPKLKPEAEFLKKQLEIRNRDFLVIWLKLPMAEMINRSLKRMRNVDDSKHIQVRIKWYKEQQGKTLNYFKKIKKIRMVDANHSVFIVTKEIERILNDYQRSQRNRKA